MKALIYDRIKEVVEGLNPSIFGENERLTVGTIKSLSNGQNHDNYLIVVNGRKFLFRISARSKNGIASAGAIRRYHIATEYARLRSIEKLPFVPKAYYKNLSGGIIGRPFLITDYIEGTTVKRVTSGDIVKFAKFFAMLHSINRDYGLDDINLDRTFRTWTKNNIYYITEFPKFKSFTDDRFKAHLKNAYREVATIKYKRTRTAVLHNDFSVSNLVRTRNGIKLIDWEGVSIGPPQYELAMIINKGKLSGNRLHLFLDTYINRVEYKNPALQLREYEMLFSLQRLCFLLNKVFTGHLEKSQYDSDSRMYNSIKDIHYEFRYCKKLGLFPKDSLLHLSL
jgi:aminoglycoside phosphotransferase (APT) family kinase protein